MSFPSHRLPPPVSQTVGGAAAAAAAASNTTTQQLSDVHVAENSSIGDRYRQRQTGRTTSGTAAEPSIASSRPMLPSKHDSHSTMRTSTVAMDSKRTSLDLPRPMRPKSVMKSYMKHLTSYEHQEIFDYQQVDRKRVLCSLVFTALHVMQPRYGEENSVCLSVCPSVRHTRGLWQNGRKICPDLYTIRKNIYPNFLRRRMVGGGRPLLPEILGQPTPNGTKSPIFNQ